MTIDCAAKLTLLDTLHLVGNKLCYITRLVRALIFNWIIMNFLGSFGALSCFGKNKNAAEPSIGAVHAAPLPLDN